MYLSKFFIFYSFILFIDLEFVLVYLFIYFSEGMVTFESVWLPSLENHDGQLFNWFVHLLPIIITYLLFIYS